MREIKIIEPVYIEEFDIHVNRYLTLAQIQQICDATKKFDAYAERQQNIDMLVLYHATDIGEEELKKYDHDTLCCSGLIDAVKDKIENIWEVNHSLEYTESTQRALAQIIKQLPSLMKPLKEVVEKHGNTIKK